MFNLLTHGLFLESSTTELRRYSNFFVPNIANNENRWLPQIDVILHQQKNERESIPDPFIFMQWACIKYTHIAKLFKVDITARFIFLGRTWWDAMTSAIWFVDFLGILVNIIAMFFMLAILHSSFLKTSLFWWYIDA